MRTGKGRRIAIGAGTAAVLVLGLSAWLSWPRIRFYRLFAPLGRNAQGFLEYRHRQTGIVFVSLPGGTFWMGAQSEDPRGQNYDRDAGPDEGPVREVTVSGLLIGKYEVTQGQWKAVMGSNPSSHKGDDRPVEQVSWDDILRFAAKTGLRLPTEAEWEYACRAGAPAPDAGTGKIDEMGWYEGNTQVGGPGNTQTHAVGMKAPNGFGLHDMHGNVWEWCEDLYDADFYGRPEASDPDPVCLAGTNRVTRGGSVLHGPEICRSAHRFEGKPGSRYINVGFRPISPLP